MPYYPQWKARVAAQALLGDDGTAWQKGGVHYIGVRLADGTKTIFGQGRTWAEAIAAAKAAK